VAARAGREPPSPFQRYPCLLSAGFGDQAVPEILKPGAVLFQVNEHCDLAALAIGYKLDSVVGLFYTRRCSCPDRTAQGNWLHMCLSVLLVSGLSKLLSLKQKTLNPAYNFCSRIH
jgi:hypothetical protein